MQMNYSPIRLGNYFDQRKKRFDELCFYLEMLSVFSENLFQRLIRCFYRNNWGVRPDSSSFALLKCNSNG